MSRFKFNDENVLVSLDIGTSCLRCLVSIKKPQTLEQLYFHEIPVTGLEEGRIVNLDEFLPSLLQLLDESEKQSGRSFSEVVIGFSSKFHAFQSYGMAALSSREVTMNDIEIAIETACAVPIPDQHTRIHNKAQKFIVDGKDGILNPLGLSGLRLETEVQIVSIPKFYQQDLTRALKILGYTPKVFVHNLISYGENFTSSYQKQEGVCVCDIGHKSTRLIYYYKGKIIDMATIPFGGSHFSLALADKFKISPFEAKKIKEDWGTLEQHQVHETDQIESQEDGLFFSHKAVVDVLDKSAKYLFEKIKEHTESNDLSKKNNAGFIFTGSTCLLKGFLNLARLHLNTSVSYPKFINLENKNFNNANTFAIAEQAYLKEKFQNKKATSSAWTKLKDLF